MGVPIFTPTISIWEFWLLHLLTNTCYWQFTIAARQTTTKLSGLRQQRFIIAYTSAGGPGLNWYRLGSPGWLSSKQWFWLDWSWLCCGLFYVCLFRDTDQRVDEQQLHGGSSAHGDGKNACRLTETLQALRLRLENVTHYFWFILLAKASHKAKPKDKGRDRFNGRN